MTGFVVQDHNLLSEFPEYLCCPLRLCDYVHSSLEAMQDFTLSSLMFSNPIFYDPLHPAILSNSSSGVWLPGPVIIPLTINRFRVISFHCHACLPH